MHPGLTTNAWRWHRELAGIARGRRLAELAREPREARIDLGLAGQVERKHHAHTDVGLARLAE